MVKVPPEPECHILYSVGTLSVVRDVGRVLAIWRGTCLTALLPGETVGNTAPIPGQANVTDTLGHLGVPGSRMLVRPPKVQTSAFTCVSNMSTYAPTDMHMHYAYMHMHM